MTTETELKIKVNADTQGIGGIQGVEKAIKRVKDETEKAERLAGLLAQEYKLSQKEAAQVATELKRVAAETERAKKSATGLEKIFEGVAQGVGQGLTSIATDAVSTSVNAVKELSGAVLNAGLEFDAARAKVSTLTDDADGLATVLEGVTGEIKNQVGTTELLQGSYDILSAGFTDTADAAQITEASVKAAVGGFSDFGTVADATTSVLNAYGLAATEAESITDKFIATQNAGKITVDQYAQQIGKVAPLASQAGVSLDELNGFIATATASGVQVESTFSGLRQALAAVLKPTSDAASFAQELGIQFDAAALRSKGLQGILGELNATGNDTPEVLTRLFGSVEAVAAIAPSAGDGFIKLGENIDASVNSAGDATTAFDKVADSLPGLIQALQTQLGEQLRAIGTAFGPAFEGGLKLISDIVTEATQASGGLDEIAAAGDRLKAVLTENPELARQLGQAIATLVDEGVDQIALLIDATTAFVSEEENIEFIASAIEDLGGVLRLLGQGARFVIALAEGLIQLNEGTTFVERLIPPIRILNETIDRARAAADGLFQQLEKLGLIDLPEAQEFQGISAGLDQASAALDNYNAAAQKVADAAPEKPIQDTAGAVTDAANDIESGVDAINAKYQQLADEADLATQQLIASRLEQGASAEEITGIEAKALNDRIALNRQKLAELQAINQDSLSPEDAEKLGAQIVATETEIATDRIKVAKEQAAERQRIAEEAAKAEADALKEIQEERKRLAEQDFGDDAEQRQRVFDDAAEDRAIATENRINNLKEQGQDRVEALKLQSQKSLQADAEAFQKRQQADARAFQKALDAERDAESSRIDAAASEAEFQTALRLAGSDEERQQLEDEREFAQKRAKILAEEQAKALRTTNEGDELTPVEQARLALEERVAAKQQAFQDAQQTEAAAFEAQQQEQRRADEQAIAELERKNAEAIAQVKRDAADEERQRERDFEDAQQQLERDFKDEQRRLDKQNAEEIARILEGARGGLDGARRDGGPVRGGGTYLVGEDGPELITPSRSGYVHTARETAAMMAQTRSPVHINAPQGTGTSMHGVEVRLDKLTKLVEANRTVQAPATYIFEGEQAPTQTAVDMELERISGLVKQSGL